MPVISERHLMLFVLSAISTTNVASRSLLPFMYARRDSNAETTEGMLVEFSRWKYGLLYGLAFSVPFTLSLIIARTKVEKSRRMAILLIGVLIRSASTVAMGFADRDWHFFVARGGMGIGEGLCTPAAYSLISNVFAKEEMELPNAIYGLGTWFGMSIASFAVWVTTYYSWRIIHFFFAVLGVCFGWLGFVSIREPLRCPEDDTAYLRQISKQISIKNKLQQLLLGPLPLIALGASFRMFCSQEISAFLPNYYRCVWPQEYHYIIAPSHGVVLLLGGPAAGVIGAKLSAIFGIKKFSYFMMVPIIGGLLSIPILAGALLIEGITTSLSFVLILILSLENWHAPLMVLLQGALPPPFQNVGLAFYLSVASMVASSGPALIGTAYLYSDQLPVVAQVDPCRQLSYLMFAMGAGALVLSSIFFGLGALALTKKPFFIATLTDELFDMRRNSDALEFSPSEAILYEENGLPEHQPLMTAED